MLYAPYKKAKQPEKKKEDDPLADLEPTGSANGSNGEDEEVYGDDAPKRKVVRKEMNEFPEVKAF